MDIYTFGGQKEIYLTKEEYELLPDYYPDTSAPINEGTFKIISINNKEKLIKAHTRKIDLNLVKNNIDILIAYRDILQKEIPYLVLPEDYIYIYNNDLIAYTMEKLSALTLQDLLRYKKLHYHYKISLLTKLGEILFTFGEIPNFPYKIYIGDLHEGNIMVSNKANLRIVDVASLFITNNHLNNGVPSSKYLELNDKIKEEKFKNKYSLYQNKIIPNKNTDIFCYTFIILNTLAQKDLSNISHDVLLKYLDYLDTLKLNQNLLYYIERLFSQEENINPYKYLDTITKEQFQKANFLIFQKKTRNKFNIFS